MRIFVEFHRPDFLDGSEDNGWSIITGLLIGAPLGFVIYLLWRTHG